MSIRVLKQGRTSQITLLVSSLFYNSPLRVFPTAVSNLLLSTFSTSDFSDEMKTRVCAKKLHSHVMLIIWAARSWLACRLGLAHILSLSSAHVLKVWTQRHVDTDCVVVTTCRVERQHEVYCPERRLADVLKMTNFIDHAHTHGGEAKWEQHGSRFYSHRPSKPSIISLLVNQIEASILCFC